MTYCVKIRKLDGKRWKFYASNGGLNSLRIHAVEFSKKEHADKTAEEINKLHGTEYQARVETFA